MAMAIPAASPVIMSLPLRRLGVPGGDECDL